MKNQHRVAFRRSRQPIPYEQAVNLMDARVAAIHSGNASELLWFLEHPPLYSAGTSARPDDLIKPDRFPVFKSGRGGQYTYHGPGQRVAYVILDLRLRNKDIRKYVHALESWLISTLAHFGLVGETRADRVGIWVKRPSNKSRNALNTEDKIGALGVRVRKWIAFHGVSLNIKPDLNHYDGIVPCGVADNGITSMSDLGNTASMHSVDKVLKEEFEKTFSVALFPEA